MKKQTSKQNLIKRAVALLAATSLVCTMQGGMSFLSKAEEEVTNKTEQVAENRVLYASDYASASATNGTVTYKNVSNQLYPKQEGDNKYLYYAQSDQTIGILRLGHSYANNKLDEYTPITVTPGQTYVIEFDYRLKPYADTTQYPDWPTSNLTLGVAVGSARDDYSAVTHTTYFDTTSWHTDIEVLALQSSKPDVDWTHKSITVTIPNDCDVSRYNALQLYATLGQKCGLHIDNVKVTAQLAGVNVSYDVSGDVTNTYESSGYVPYTAMENNNTAMRWYTDKDMTTPFLSTTYNRTGELTTVKLYGVKDNSKIAFVKGDANQDGKVDKEDIGALRTQLVTKVTDSARADMNGDATVDVKDIVRSLRSQADNVNTNSVKLGGVTVSEYSVITVGIDTADTTVNDRLNVLRPYVTTTENKENKIKVSLNKKMDTAFYVIEIGEGQVRVEGGSSNALAVALDTVISYIKAGVDMDKNCSTEFVYTSQSVPTVSSLVWAENF